MHLVACKKAVECIEFICALWLFRFNGCLLYTLIDVK